MTLISNVEHSRNLLDYKLLKKRRRNRRGCSYSNNYKKRKYKPLWLPQYKREIVHSQRFALKGFFAYKKNCVAIHTRIAIYSKTLQYMTFDISSNAINYFFSYVCLNYLHNDFFLTTKYDFAICCIQPVNDCFLYFPFNLKESIYANRNVLKDVLALYSEYASSLLFFVPELKSITLLFYEKEGNTL